MFARPESPFTTRRATRLAMPIDPGSGELFVFPLVNFVWNW